MSSLLGWTRSPPTCAKPHIPLTQIARLHAQIEATGAGAANALSQDEVAAVRAAHATALARWRRLVRVERAIVSTLRDTIDDPAERASFIDDLGLQPPGDAVVVLESALAAFTGPRTNVPAAANLAQKRSLPSGAPGFRPPLKRVAA